MAAPINSAMSVATHAETTVSPRKAVAGAGKCSRILTASDLPVATPSLAAMCWITMSMTVPSVITHSSS